MSIEIGRAKELLDLAEKISDKPELIFSELFKGGVDEKNFLFMLNINGEYFEKYLMRYFESLPMFQNCSLALYSEELHVYVPPLKSVKCHHSQLEDKIMRVNLQNKTYKLCNSSIERYKEIMDEKYELTACELSDFWKRFEDFSFKKRLKTAFSYLFSDKKLYIRLCDFVYVLVVSRNKIDAITNIQKENISSTNERNLKNYTEKIEKQNFVLEHAPAQIEKILAKQEEIAAFLRKMGYQEVEN